MTTAADQENVTLEELLTAREQAAKAVLDLGEKYLPLFERLDKAVHACESRDSIMTKVRTLAAGSKH